MKAQDCYFILSSVQINSDLWLDINSHFLVAHIGVEQRDRSLYSIHNTFICAHREFTDSRKSGHVSHTWIMQMEYFISNRIKFMLLLEENQHFGKTQNRRYLLEFLFQKKNVKTNRNWILIRLDKLDYIWAKRFSIWIKNIHWSTIEWPNGNQLLSFRYEESLRSASGILTVRMQKRTVRLKFIIKLNMKSSCKSNGSRSIRKPWMKYTWSACACASETESSIMCCYHDGILIQTKSICAVSRERFQQCYP